MTTCGWLWIYAGALLVLLELVVPGFILCFFGLAAMTVGLLRFLLGDGFAATGQLAAFSVFSILYIVLLRRWLKATFTGAKEKPTTDVDHPNVGRRGTVTDAIVPPLTGRVLVGDAEWTASAATPLPVGAIVTVVAQDNLTVTVTPVT